MNQVLMILRHLGEGPVDKTLDSKTITLTINLLVINWKIGFYRWYFADILDIEQSRNEIQHRSSNGRNIGKKNQKNIGLELINRWKNRTWSNGGNVSKYRKYIGNISNISMNISDISGNIGDFFECFFFINILYFS